MMDICMTRLARRQTALASALALTFALAGTAIWSISTPVRADDGDLTITRLTEDQFPTLKTKATNSNFALYGAAGNAVLRSRYGTDADASGNKIYVYGYQLDLKSAYDVLGYPGVTAITLDLPKMPPLVTAPKVSKEAKVYVLTETGSSGDHGIDVQSVTANDGKITFTFAAPVTAGKTPGTGAHSLWFGLISTTAATQGQVNVETLAPAKASQPPVNPQPSPQVATSQAAANQKTGQSIAQPEPIDPTKIPPLTLFIPAAAPTPPGTTTTTKSSSKATTNLPAAGNTTTGTTTTGN
jgi:hypothetical protein